MVDQGFLFSYLSDLISSRHSARFQDDKFRIPKVHIAEGAIHVKSSGSCPDLLNQGRSGISAYSVSGISYLAS